MRLRSPPFTTRWVTAVALMGTYVCLSALVIQVHEVLPSAPSFHGALGVGIDLERAWSDLSIVCPQLVGKPICVAHSRRSTDSREATSL